MEQKNRVDERSERMQKKEGVKSKSMGRRME
jgi:hypothetical protein